ncbi:MAG: hypothetical protein HWN66_10960 [Candidatus Helarchaeota archaeon]|nr:hypothetical protein [Candidatus Helarchaeota archaeon]
MKYQNNHIGLNFIWIIMLLPFTVLTAINGYYLLRAPRLEEPIQAILLLSASVLEICALFFLLLRPRNYLEITTKNNYYDLRISPFKKELKEIPISKGDIKDKINSEFLKANNISPTHRQYTTLLLGIFFMVSGLIMLIFYLVVGIFGNLYTMLSIIFGTILITKAISQDFSDKNGVLIDYNDSKKSLSFQQNFRSKFVRINTLQPTELEITNNFRKLNIFEILLIPALLSYSTIETIQSWAISTSSTSIINSVITSIFLGLVYFLFFIYLCVPSGQLRLRTPTTKYDIPITYTVRTKRFLDGILSKDLKNPFILRCLFIIIIGISSIMGTLIYLNLYFFI